MTTTDVISNQYKQKFEFINFQNGIIFDFLVLLICCLSFGFSWIESRVNLDSHHWGFMYVQALDLKRGLIPYKETLTIYGILTSYIQSLSLTLFGEKLMSIGIATGIFYSFNLFLSYQIFLKFLPKYCAYFSTLIIFLLQPYISYPWSNLYSNTFLLLGILFFIKGKKVNVFFSGLFIGLSFLCRYSLIPSILSTFLVLFVYEISFRKNNREIPTLRILFYSLGFLIPILLFLLFLISNDVLDDFLIQNKTMVLISGQGVTISNALPILLKSIITFGGGDHSPYDRESKIIFITIIFFWNLITLFYFLYKLFFRKKNVTQEETLVIAFCLISIFGYLNSIHYYEVFYLVNGGASLGIGVLIYTIFRGSQQLSREIKIIMLLPLISLCFIWANSLIFSQNPCAPYPWRLDILNGKGIVPTEISIFKGKILNPKYYEFYQKLFHQISKFDNSYYIINYTKDPVAMIINNLQKVQSSSIYYPEIEQASPGEAQKIKQIIDTKKAVILSEKDLHISGYKVIFNQPYPSEEELSFLEKIYVTVPQED